MERSDIRHSKGWRISAFGLHPPYDHAPAPPTVILSILIVGWPTPTGTPCPALPQTQASA